jgi:1-acyl-sn-glycerol-3-phosphate acyltransferase
VPKAEPLPLGVGRVTGASLVGAARLGSPAGDLSPSAHHTLEPFKQALFLRGSFFLVTNTAMPSECRPLYTFARLLFQFIFRVVFRTRITGRDRAPRDGGLLVVCNHISFADPPMVAVAIPRTVDFLAMAELFRKPLLGGIARALGAFPVDRSRVDQRAAREAIRRLRAGHCLVIFPEAGIRLGENSVLGGNPVFRAGAGAIASLGRAAILPVIVRDTRKPYNWRNWLPIHRGKLRRETMSITIGHPFCLWIPESVPNEERRQRAREMLREQLLKTVELN